MYKLVAIDLDGTLLDSYGNISLKNKSVIEAVKRKGTKVIIASGRNKTSALSFSKDINSSEYVICNNGATLYDIKNNKNIYNQYIDKKKALDIIKICDENSIFYSIYTEDFVIANTMNYNVLFFESENGKTLEEQRTNIKIIKDVYNYIKENENVNVLKMNICDNNKIIFDRIISKLKNIKEVNVLDVEHMTKKIIKTGTEEVTIEYYYTEITSEGVNKWNAISRLIDILNISKEEVITIGDNANDIMMIKEAGMGVIMGNAAPYLKDSANFETKTNNEDGVAEALEKLILE